MPDIIFEVSSEAARKVGGIYTVLQTKAPYLVKKYGDNYILLGFLDELTTFEFREEKADEEIQKIIDKLGRDGIEVKYGRWTLGGGAQIFLISGKKHGELMVTYENHETRTDKKLNYIKFLLWKHFQIDSLMEKSWDFSENVLWGWCVGMLLEELISTKRFSKKRAVAHFHEWISGSALLYCKLRKLPLKTVFTTHATVLGRTLSSYGHNLLADAARGTRQIDVSVAYQLKVEGKHQLEVAAANAADILTTVSETVADEVKYILGRKSDIITINGIDFEAGKDEKQISSLSKYVRLELIQFLESLFIPYYDQSYKNPLLIYISGRYEFKNKGFDIYINALGKLNSILREKAPERRVFAFIFTPTAVSGPRVDMIKNYLLLDKIHEILEKTLGEDFRTKDYTNLRSCIKNKIVSSQLRQKIETMMSGFSRGSGKPTLNCFDLIYPSDQIVRACALAGLTNAKEDVVKVIFYPTYVKSNDGLLNLDYYDVISGMDVGVFPSRYEPFGYTPLEAALNLNVSITTDNTGFGRYVSSRVNLKNRGITVLRMSDVSETAVVDELANELEKLYNLDLSSLEQLKSDAYNLVRLCDWKELIQNYFKAYQLTEKTAQLGTSL
ncbi:MAG: glycogen/starch synthase [Candidatus Anstonellales archaeon]